MRITQYPKVYRDALAYWCAIRNLGFKAEEIFLGFGPVDKLPDCLFLQLQTQGKAFTVTVGQLPGAQEAAVHSTWTNLSQDLQQSSDEERNLVFRAHPIGHDLGYYAVFVQAIEQKGIAVPVLSPD
jgi:hypothetical protein